MEFKLLNVSYEEFATYETDVVHRRGVAIV